jgi:hypothetical protein
MSSLVVGTQEAASPSDSTQEHQSHPWNQRSTLAELEDLFEEIARLGSQAMPAP